jgi:acetoin:2,6-dichlorophenolindophenol oxidoreductase subunit alpha
LVLISNEKLIELYAAMVKCRMMAERAGLLIRQGKLAASLDSGPGREATIAGVAVDLLPEDTLSPSRGNLASTFIEGMPLEGFFASLAASHNGRAHCTAKRSGVEMAPGMPTASMTIEKLDSACAAAKAHKAAKNGKIVVAFCGEEQVGPHCLREKLSLAGRHNLPVIFVCPDELRNGSEKKSTLSKTNGSAPEALAFGVPVITVDGSDVVAVYRVACESIARARQGRGPTLIQCVAGSSSGLNGSDHGSDELAGVSDPILTMESYLAGKGLFNPGLKRQIESGFCRELDRATGFLRN